MLLRAAIPLLLITLFVAGVQLSKQRRAARAERHEGTE